MFSHEKVQSFKKIEIHIKKALSSFLFKKQIGFRIPGL